MNRRSSCVLVAILIWGVLAVLPVEALICDEEVIEQIRSYNLNEEEMYLMQQATNCDNLSKNYSNRCKSAEQTGCSPPNLCTKEFAERTRSSSSFSTLDKVGVLSSFGCYTLDLEKKLAADSYVQVKRAIKQSKERMAADQAAAQAKTDAFNQKMANKCGEYPMELQIGMSEELLRMGCVGPVGLVGEDQNTRFYRVYDVDVSVYRGKVVRWIVHGNKKP